MHVRRPDAGRFLLQEVWMKRILACSLAACLGGACLQTARADILLAGFTADAIVRYDGSGALVGVFATHPTMDGPTAMVYDPLGNLLVLNEFSHNVLRFDGSTGAFLDTFIMPAALGSVGLGDPADMEVGPDGQLYLMSHGSTGSNIWKYDVFTGAYLGSFAFAPPPTHTHGLTLGPGGDFYQGYVELGQVVRFDGSTGAFEGVFTSGPGVGPIADIVFGPAHLFVTLDGGGGVARFDAVSGAFVDFLIPAGAFQSHWGLMIDGGMLYVSNKDTGTVKRFDATTGAFLGDFIVGGPSAFDMLAMAVVPEPAAAALLVLGLAAVVGVARRRSV